MLTLDDYIKIANALYYIDDEYSEDGVCVELQDKYLFLDISSGELNYSTVRFDDDSPSLDVYLTNAILSFGNEQEQRIKLDEKLLNQMLSSDNINIYIH